MSNLAISKRIKEEERTSPKELQQFMNHFGISKKEFAEIIGVTEPAVDLWLLGKRNVSVTLTRLITMFTKYPKLLKEF